MFFEILEVFELEKNIKFQSRKDHIYISLAKMRVWYTGRIIHSFLKRIIFSSSLLK
jgi:hypothetical protein